MTGRVTARARSSQREPGDPRRSWEEPRTRIRGYVCDVTKTILGCDRIGWRMWRCVRGLLQQLTALLHFFKISNNFLGFDTQGSIHGTEVSGLDNTCYLDIHLLRLATQPHQVARRLSLRIGAVPKDSLPSNKTEGVVYWNRLHTSIRVCSYQRSCPNMSLLHNPCSAHQNCIQPCVDKHLFLA